MQFAHPETLQEAYALLAQGEWKILSGGTDFYPALSARAIDFDVMDISRIGNLGSISQDADGNWHIGALATWTDIINHQLPDAFDGLKLSAREVGSIQIQNRATLAGNICNASPAADGVPPLLALDAVVKLGAADGERYVPLSEFILGNRHTVLKPNEIVTGLFIPAAGAKGKSSFLKLGSRKYLVISISMVSARLAVDPAGKIEDAAISVGSCSAVAVRLTALEQKLTGKRIADNLSDLIEDGHFKVLTPIDDVRATGQYRLVASRELVARALVDVAFQFSQGNF